MSSSKDFEHFASSADPRFTSGSADERIRALLEDNDAMRTDLLVLIQRAKAADGQMELADRQMELAAHMMNQADAVLKSSIWRAISPMLAIMRRIPSPLRSALRQAAGSTVRAVRRVRDIKLGARGRGDATALADRSDQAEANREVPRWKRLGTIDDSTHFRDWLAVQAADLNSTPEKLKERLSALQFRPLISVVMPAFNTTSEGLERAIRSVRDQNYSNWELCIADDASQLPHVCEIIARHAGEDPKRIKWVRRAQNGNISLATNSALSLATGEFVAFLDHDDALSNRALLEVAEALNEAPDTLILYSDEDRMSEADEQRHTPFFKPAWDPDLILGHNYVGHLMVLRRSIVAAIGGMREGLEGSQDHDLILRAANVVPGDKIKHLPRLLYHWTVQPTSFSTTSLDRCVRASRRAVADHLSAREDAAGARVVAHPNLPDVHRVIWPLPAELPLVSVLIPTRDRAELLRGVTSGLLHKTDYPNLEVIILDNGSEEEETRVLLAALSQDSRVRVLSLPGPFNYSKLNNHGASQAGGEILLLLNNDVLVIEPSWLREMVSHVIRPGVGTVGAKLLFADRTIQHGGVVLGVGEFAGGPGIAGHFALYVPAYSRGYFSQAMLTRTVSANTAACLVVRKSVFEAVGGLNEQELAVSFNDVDFCLKVGRLGLRHVWTPFATLYHLESASRGSDSMLPEKMERAGSEGRYMRETWGPLLDQDPFYNPNLSRESPYYELPIPPRY